MSALEQFEPHRPQLTGLCYRMLGSAADADDAVQETMLRAWRSFDGFDGRSTLSTWLYRIATNVCIDQLRQRQRRGLPVYDGRAGTVDDELFERPRTHWLEPIPDARVLPEAAPPERVAQLRQSLRLAFVSAMQELPPKQRAALLLKDVLGFSAREIAETLDDSVASVNSALQRARTKLAARALDADRASTELNATQRELVEQYVDAFHAYDVDRLVSLLREDVTMCMPPYTLWLEGRRSIGEWFLGRGIGCRGSRLVAVEACGSVAFAQYRRGPERYEAWSLSVLDLGPDAITSLTFFLDVGELFPRFGLPLHLDPHGV